jgi:hypothetical protein
MLPMRLFMGLFDTHGKRVYHISQIWLIIKFSGITVTVEGLNA